MLSLRIVTAGAVILFVSGATGGGAAAQTATGDTAGKPLELLRIVEQPLKPKTAAHGKIHAAAQRIIAARSSKRHSVIAEQSEPPAQAAPVSSPEDADSAPPAGVAAADSAAQPAPALSDPSIGPLVVGSQTVEVASQSDVNAIDLAADAAAERSANAASSKAAPNDTAPNAASSDQTAAIPAPLVSDTALKSDSIKAAPAAPAGPAAATPQATRSAVGSPGWIAQVMAALAGAVAAGSIAWFLIGSAPQRTYG